MMMANGHTFLDKEDFPTDISMPRLHLRLIKSAQVTYRLSS